MALPTGTLSIGRPTRTCAASGRGLEVGEAYVAALVERAGDVQGPQRLDFSLEGWKAKRPAARDLVAFWRSHVAEPGQKVKPILEDDALLDLFDSTVGGEITDGAGASGSDGADGVDGGASGSRQALRFVLAILLIRRRLLVQEGVGPGGVMKLRRRGDERPPEGPPLIELADPGLDEGTLSDVLAQLEDLGAVATAPAAAGSPGGSPAGGGTPGPTMVGKRAGARSGGAS